MKKFLLLHQGFETPTPEIGAGWMAWFEKIAPHTVDMGNPFVAGREIGKDGASTELDYSGVPMTGYTIVNAENMDAAQALLDGLPMIHSTRIYELGKM
ncbi:hypothetical protein C6I20_07335 [Aeromicrobium sp. A1-2]|uniref:hypothetical protein n=1 Tax=Aeromicrobium sp. A1-2 TaxID=2107713 RepID=UPI000E50B715|nr:hypothetical protein [Aeromicrobium sp. A1-2]AXT85017.1 hypothetical protein C6I20_07335 [Aeromicrobium sp. A1-2]